MLTQRKMPDKRNGLNSYFLASESLWFICGIKNRGAARLVGMKVFVVLFNVTSECFLGLPLGAAAAVLAGFA